jgi:AbrB family looped-hinge helix DNA binding protein
MATATVDAKGRLSIPADVRGELGIKEGDVFFIETDAEHSVIHLAKAQNPFDALAEHALSEYRAGRTRRLRDYATSHDITVDDEQ